MWLLRGYFGEKGKSSLCPSLCSPLMGGVSLQSAGALPHTANSRISSDEYSSYSNNLLTKMLHWAVITSRIVLVYGFYGEQCVSRSWAGYIIFSLQLETLCWRNWRLSGVLEGGLLQKTFPFERLIIKINLCDTTGYRLNCMAGWLFRKIQSC